MGVVHLPEPMPIAAPAKIEPKDDVSEALSRGLRTWESRKKIIMYTAIRNQQQGYMVGRVFEHTIFFVSLEEAFKRAISLMGLEERDVIVLDKIPGVE